MLAVSLQTLTTELEIVRKMKEQLQKKVEAVAVELQVARVKNEEYDEEKPIFEARRDELNEVKDKLVMEATRRTTAEDKLKRALAMIEA